MVLLMKATILPDHFKFFQQNGTIEFSGFIKSDILTQLNSEIDSITKLNKSNSSDDNLWLVGRDLWRKNALIKKFVNQPNLAEVAAQLSNTKVVRLGYDQLIQPPDFITLAGNLDEVSHLKGILCSLWINLKGETQAPFPTHPGNIAFFSAEYPLDYTQFTKNNRFLVIVYVTEKAVYKTKSLDMLKLEYRVGEVLKDKLHPVLYRI